MLSALALWLCLAAQEDGAATPPPEEPAATTTSAATNEDAAAPAEPGAAESSALAPTEPPATTEETPEALDAPAAPLNNPSPGARGPDLVGTLYAVMGGGLGLLPWLPTWSVCCTASALMAAAYPLSRGNPATSANPLWVYACYYGVVIGMVGWVMALVAAGIGSLWAGGGVAGGAGLASLRGGTLPRRRGIAMGAGVLAAALLMPAAVILAALSGFLPWAAVLTWVQTTGNLPSTGSWAYTRWLLLNAVFMSAVVAGLGLLGMSAGVPLVGALGAWSLTSWLLPSE
ncbi:MAG: hypothetical protein AB2A00_18845 [Myxococcota bacterium]